MQRDDLYFMRRAVEEAARCRPEDDRIHPLVGAVLARNDELRATAFRGEVVTERKDKSAHAEFILLERKLHNETVAGDTIYTTLEPCTARGKGKTPCVEHIIRRKIGRVVIGILDPNQAITGKGILRLRQANIQVDLFPPKLMAKLEDLNRAFIALHRTTNEMLIPAWRGYKTLDELVPREARKVVMIGQNLVSRLGMKDTEREKFVGEVRAVIKRGAELVLVIMTPDALKSVHKEAAEDLAEFTLPAFDNLRRKLGALGKRVHVVFHPAATLSLLTVDGEVGYVTPKFQKTADINRRLTLKLEQAFFDRDAHDRMLYDGDKKKAGALTVPLSQAADELRARLVACDLQPSVSHRGTRRGAKRK